METDHWTPATIINLVTQLGILISVIVGAFKMLYELRVSHDAMMRSQAEAAKIREEMMAKQDSLHREINSRLTELVKATSEASHAEGVIAGEAKQRDRSAEAKAKDAQ